MCHQNPNSASVDRRSRVVAFSVSPIRLAQPSPISSCRDRVLRPVRVGHSKEWQRECQTGGGMVHHVLQALIDRECPREKRDCVGVERLSGQGDNRLGLDRILDLRPGAAHRPGVFGGVAVEGITQRYRHLIWRGARAVPQIMAASVSLRVSRPSAAARRTKAADVLAFFPSRIIRACAVYTLDPPLGRRSVSVPIC